MFSKEADAATEASSVVEASVRTK